MDRKIVHFLHQHHPLLKVHKLSGFTCDRCKTIGSGTRYRCDPCNFDLHLYCAVCPPSIISPLHPSHKLTLFVKNCDSCCRRVNGLFYRCNSCDFDIHPLCLLDSSPQSQKPQSDLRPRIDHSPHNHPLKLTRRDTQFTCGACKIGGTGKRYICDPCNVDLHWFCATCPSGLSSSLHPQHELRLCWKHCDECGQDVEGAFYRCQECDFDLHPLCHHKTISGNMSLWVPSDHNPSKIKHSAPPSTAVEVNSEVEKLASMVLTSYFFMHPEHDLKEGEVDERGWCEVCGKEVAGNGFSCVDCSFYVHKGCSSIRPTVRDMAHSNHALHYLRSRVWACAICRKDCIKWRYCCNVCNVHVHKDCLQGPVSPPPPPPPPPPT